MNELVKFGAIFSEREPVKSLRGSGLVRYYMNRHVAEFGSRSPQEELDITPKYGAKLKVLKV